MMIPLQLYEIGYALYVFINIAIVITKNAKTTPYAAPKIPIRGISKEHDATKVIAPIILKKGTQFVISFMYMPGSCKTYVPKKKYPKRIDFTIGCDPQNSLPIKLLPFMLNCIISAIHRLTSMQT